MECNFYKVIFLICFINESLRKVLTEIDPPHHVKLPIDSASLLNSMTKKGPGYRATQLGLQARAYVLMWNDMMPILDSEFEKQKKVKMKRRNKHQRVNNTPLTTEKEITSQKEG